MGASSGAGTTFTSEAPEVTPLIFCGVRVG